MGICAGNKADLVGERERDAGRPRWTNWSLDHQLEFCECSAVADTFTGADINLEYLLELSNVAGLLNERPAAKAYLDRLMSSGIQEGH